MNIKHFIWLILIFCWPTYTSAYNLVIENRTRENYQISIFIHPENFSSVYGRFDTDTISSGVRSINVENEYLRIPDIPNGISEPFVKVQVVVSHAQAPLKTYTIEHIPCKPECGSYSGSRIIMLAIPPYIKVILSDEAVIIEIDGKHYFQSRLRPNHIPLEKFIKENFDYDAFDLGRMAGDLYDKKSQELAAAYELIALAKKETEIQDWFFKRCSSKKVEQFQKDYSGAEGFLEMLIDPSKRG